MTDPAHLNAQYAWAGADQNDRRAVAQIFKRFEDLALGSAWAALVPRTWAHWQVHAYYVNAGRDLERAIAEIVSQVSFTS